MESKINLAQILYDVYCYEENGGILSPTPFDKLPPRIQKNWIAVADAAISRVLGQILRIEEDNNETS